jgi:hypothetical protein
MKLTWISRRKARGCTDSMPKSKEKRKEKDTIEDISINKGQGRTNQI